MQARLVRICRTNCRHHRLFAFEEDVLRFCDGCARWYHLDCLARPESVTQYRARRDVPLPPWLRWRAPANTDPAAEAGFLQLVTLPIQRNHPLLAPGRMATFELVVSQIRQDILNRDWTYPSTSPEQVQYVQALIRRFTIPEDHFARWYALDNFIKFVNIPLQQRLVYRCPRNASHLM